MVERLRRHKVDCGYEYEYEYEYEYRRCATEHEHEHRLHLTPYRLLLTAHEQLAGAELWAVAGP
jgi:hypothetical protein